MDFSCPDPVLPKENVEESIRNLLRLIELNRSVLMSVSKLKALKERIYRCRDTFDFNMEKVLLYYLSIVEESDYRACISSDVIKQFIELGSNINDQDGSGRAILHWVAEKGVITTEYFQECGNRGKGDFVSKLELINYLVEQGADITLTDRDVNDPFKLLLITNHPEVIITTFMDIIGKYNYSDATRRGMVPSSPAQILNQRNKDGFTSLHFILTGCYYGVDMIKKSLELGADPNVAVESRSGISALQYALIHQPDFDVPLLTILIPTNVELITANNDREPSSCKILNLLLTKDWSNMESTLFEDFLDKLIAVGFSIPKDILLRAIRSNSFPCELVGVLLRKNVPITVGDITEAIRFQRFDVALLLLNTLYETDQEKVQKIRTDHPGLLCECLIRVAEHPSKSTDVTIVDVIEVLLEKFGFDVNFSDCFHYIVHSLIRRNYGDANGILDYLLTKYPHLDIDKKVGSVSALELALISTSFNFACKLIRNFASIADLILPPPTGVGFTECYQLLYQLGMNIKFGKPNSRAMLKEIVRFKEWMDIQKKTVKSLTKLCTLVIRKNLSSRIGIEEITKNFELPDKVVKMLNFTDGQDCHVPPNDQSNSGGSDGSNSYFHCSF